MNLSKIYGILKTYILPFKGIQRAYKVWHHLVSLESAFLWGVTVTIKNTISSMLSISAFDRNKITRCDR